MAFAEKCGKEWRVKHGTNGLTLYRYHGREAEKRARAKMRELHRKYDPFDENRGRSASRRLGRCGV